MALPLSSFFFAPSYAVWYWLLAGLLILYLIKPKPINQTIPSLMFLLQDKGRAFRNSFLRYLYRDFVFFLQLLILALLVAAACQPFINVARTSFVGTSVIVLDASASMHTDDGRWEAAIDAAKQALTSQNTLILVKNRPVVIGDRIARGEAEDLLNDLEPSDTETNLYAAIVASRQYTEGQDSVVTVISDFLNSDEQQDYAAAIRTIQASGATVTLVPVGTEDAQNVGIISLDVEEEKTRIGLRNYNREATAVSLSAGSFEQTVPLGPGSTDYVTITTPPGETTVRIDTKDDFPLDDSATILNSDSFGVRVLIVTNDADIRKSPFWYALQAVDNKTVLDLSVDVSQPPAIPNPASYDIVVFDSVNSALLVQRVVRDTAAHVNDGGAAIVMYQDDLFGMNFEGMLPYTYTAAGGTSAIITGELSAITKDVEFGDVQHYHVVTGEGGRVLAESANGEPLISLIPRGQGAVLYYGVDDRASSFPLEPYYPVFWKRVIDTLTGRVNLDQVNVRTGSIPLSAEQPKKSPGAFSGFYDNQGVYEYKDHHVAANLLSEPESDVRTRPLAKELESVRRNTADDRKKQELTNMVLIASILLLFLELFIVKYRGNF